MEIKSKCLTELDQKYKEDCDQLQRTKNEILFDSGLHKSPVTTLQIEKDPRIIKYFQHNLPLLYQLSQCGAGEAKRKLIREWAINLFESPCRMSQLEFIDTDENYQTLMKQEHLTRKYPYYVWHLTKKHHQIPELEAAQDAEENKFISLYCSEYLHEAVTSIEHLGVHKHQQLV